MRFVICSVRPNHAEAARTLFQNKDLETFPIEAMDAADTDRNPLEFGIVVTAAAASLLMLIEMDHFVRHRRHQQVGGFDHPDRDPDFIQFRLGFDAPPEMAETIACAHNPKNEIVRMRKIHSAKGQGGAQIFIGGFQAFGGQVQPPPGAIHGVPICRSLAHGQI